MSKLKIQNSTLKTANYSLRTIRAGGTSKNPFFQNFFYLFPHKHLQILTIRKSTNFQPNAQPPPILEANGRQ